MGIKEILLPIFFLNIMSRISNIVLGTSLVLSKLVFLSKYL